MAGHRVHAAEVEPDHGRRAELGDARLPGAARLTRGAHIRPSAGAPRRAGSVPGTRAIAGSVATRGRACRDLTACYARLSMSSLVTHRATFSGYGAGNPRT